MKNLLLFMFACLLGNVTFAQLNCNQVNASMSLSNNNHYAILNNTSSPASTFNIYTTTTIDWGDNSTSYQYNSTGIISHGYLTGGTYNVQLIYSVLDSMNNITCADTTWGSVTVTSNPCAVSLTKTAVNNNTWTFDANNTNSGINFSWNFGDGNWGSGSPVTHTYTNPGTYNVQLISGGSGCGDTAYTTVTVAPNVISGRIYYDSLNSPNFSDTFKVWLITYDAQTNILAAVDSQIVSGFGYADYSFTNKTSGDYRTKAAHLNGPSSGTGPVPTYHNTSLLWSNATVITHTGGSSLYKDIAMQNGTVTAGPGFVGGNVLQGANKGTANGIEGLTILLLDGSNPIAFATTDANGDYSFQNVPVGNYTVHPEQLSFATTAATVNVTNSSATHAAVNFERSLSGKTIKPIANSVENVNSSNVEFTAYPNPAHNVVNITWGTTSNEQVSVSISDITGKVLYNTNTTLENNMTIDVSSFAKGIYILNIETENNSQTQKLSIQ